jgi:hypothetical protein
MQGSRSLPTVAWLALALSHPAAGQQPSSPAHSTVPADSARAEIRAVLRAFYSNLESRNWDALASYVLSPKLLERRGGPRDLQAVARDRTRSRGWSHPATRPVACPTSASTVADSADIRVDGDWADVSATRCSGTVAGVDALGLLYFESRWRFIYTDLFQAPPPAATARR